MSAAVGMQGLYRADGVRITHDPFAPEMAAKYGKPGQTDREGFDPYADSVGAGIYSGTVQRNEDGSVVIGKQYQGHNPRPGPVYSGGGYTPMSRAIALFHSETERGVQEEKTTLGKLLHSHPDLVNDVSTGGALPLHTGGMSRTNQHATAFLVAKGADIEALDTYGYTPLHRMASNNLDIGAAALLAAGADPMGLAREGGGALQPRGSHTPATVAQQSAAAKVSAVLKRHGPDRAPGTDVSTIGVYAPAVPDVSGTYSRRGAEHVPAGFSDACVMNQWDVGTTWAKLNGGQSWWAHESNPSYIYFNQLDRMWWIDGPDGLGVFKAPGPSWCPPGGSIRWQALDGATPAPTLSIHR